MASLMKSMKKFLMDNLVLIIALLIGVVGIFTSFLLLTSSNEADS